MPNAQQPGGEDASTEPESERPRRRRASKLRPADRSVDESARAPTEEESAGPPVESAPGPVESAPEPIHPAAPEVPSAERGEPPAEPAPAEARPGPARPPAGPLERDAAVALIEGADVLVSQGEYEQAAIIYTRVIGHRDADLHVAALLGLAECRFRLDEEEAALQAWIVATQAPETPLTWLAWKRLAAARVREANLPGAARAYREAERRAPLSERAEIASRLGWLNKEMGNERAAGRYFSRARAGGVGVPVATYVILAVTVGIGLTTYLSPDGQVLLALFGLDKAAVAAGEIYRLFTVVLVHSPIVPLHLIGNMYALYLVGPIVEALYGRFWFVAIYALTAAAGSAASYVLVPADSVGASGAIFGLFGLMFLGLRAYRPVLGRQARSLTGQIGLLVVLNLILGLGLGAGVIDNAAHVGGLLAGGWFGLLIRPRGAPTREIAWPLIGRRTGVAATAGAASPETDARSPVEWLVAILAVAIVLAVIAICLNLGPAR